MAKPELRARPEQQFFDDPALDRLMGFAFALSAEVYVLRDRVAHLEQALAAKGVLPSAELEGFARTAEQERAAHSDRDAFVAALMDNIAGRQKSNSLG